MTETRSQGVLVRGYKKPTMLGKIDINVSTKAKKRIVLCEKMFPDRQDLNLPTGEFLHKWLYSGAKNAVQISNMTPHHLTIESHPYALRTAS